ncbi:hypothetical protein [Pedobacter rhodius]|uniref:Uncharacterized protein n=1 Tax=Pedobacter rhodius TaxID=3004098 RepID=A0ABT4KYG9_9SPHI|nr:hypothetical protein [Pedobacter sp. SJ11]MCZ4223980.1 hypothetical protein [Pedobacter sp. SJ11]
MINDKKILIRKPFNEQYTITITSELNGVDVFVSSVVQLRYDFTVISVNESNIEVRLVQLDNILLEANNPMVREVAQVSQIFGRMYNELHLLLDHAGNVINVLNNNLILSKWKQTKTEMEKHVLSNEDLKHAIMLNDNIFNNPEKILIAAQANEFLRIYFGQAFDRDVPSKASLKGTNIFNTIELQWNTDLTCSVELPVTDSVGPITLSTLTKPSERLTKKFNKEAYNQFADKLDINSLTVDLYQKETRVIDYPTGKIQEAEVEKIEIADVKRLYNKLHYKLSSDTGIVIKQKGQENSAHLVTDSQENAESNTRFKFF